MRRLFKRRNFENSINYKSLRPPNFMKTLKTALALFFFTIIISSCDDSDCKMCEANGDALGEFCGDNLKTIKDAPGVRCK